MLNPLHLRTLATVLRVGSFSAAGRVLGYTGSAVSQQMSALEADVGRPLFERRAHGIRPTELAEQISLRAREALGAMAALEDGVARLTAGAEGELALGSFPTASEAVVPTALAAFARTHSGVSVRLDDGEPEDLVPRLVEGDLDVILVYHYDLVPTAWPSGFRRTPLLSEELVLLVGENEEGDALADFAAADWIATREGTAGALALERACAAAGFAPRICYRSNDYDVVQSLVRAGLGVAAVPRLAQALRQQARAVALHDLTVRRHVSMLHAPDREGPAGAGMRAALLAAVAQL